MEAFPAIILLTQDPVLAEAVPAQLRHIGTGDCTVLEDWAALVSQAQQQPPALALLDVAACAEALPHLPQLRQEHPLMALLGIGEVQDACHFAALALADFVTRPVSMPALLESIEHLGYERGMNAGQQQLDFPQGARFSLGEKCIRHPQGALELTDKEAAMLLCLYHHRHGWLPRQQLLEEVWGYGETITTHTLETHLYRLRVKLRERFGEEEVIITGQGGYRLHMDS